MANKTWAGSVSGDWSVAGNWSPSGVPVASDNVYVPPGAPAITAGLNQSGVNLAIVYFEPGYTGAVASSAAYLQLTCSTFIYSGTGQAYIDLSASTITAVITNSAVGTSSVPGLFLKGSALTALAVSGGNSVLAGLVGETSSCTTVRVSGAGTQFTVGSGVTTTTCQVSNGTLTVNCAATTCNCFGGTLYTGLTGAITTINTYAGNCFPNSSGTVTNMNALGGNTDTTKFGMPRTHTNLKLNPGATFSYDPNILTITTRVAPDYPIKYSCTAA